MHFHNTRHQAGTIGPRAGDGICPMPYDVPLSAAGSGSDRENRSRRDNKMPIASRQCSRSAGPLPACRHRTGSYSRSAGPVPACRHRTGRYITSAVPLSAENHRAGSCRAVAGICPMPQSKTLLAASRISDPAAGAVPDPKQSFLLMGSARHSESPSKARVNLTNLPR